jgi:hypothetical protein
MTSANSLAQDAEPPNLIHSVTIDFGKSVQFSLSIEASAVPVRAALFLRPSSDSQFKAHIVGLTSDDPLQVDMQFSPQIINLRPFAQLEYYWQVDFTDGEVSTTDPIQVTYLDTRFEWSVFSGEELSVHWVEGGIDWAQDVYAIAASSLPEIEATLGARSPGSRHLYIYPTQSDLQNSLRLAGITQASAHTLPELGVVLVAGDNNPETLIRLEQEIPHELVHVLLYERMGPGLENLPAWLNEGLATYFERSPRQVYTSALRAAAKDDSLLEMQSLCSSLPISESERILAYAQSASFINYLLDVYGTGGIVRLLDAYEEGTTCTGGVQRVFQRSLGQLENEWQKVAFESISNAVSERLLYLSIGGLVVLAAVFLRFLIRRIRT